jgi:hypothetical protein
VHLLNECNMNTDEFVAIVKQRVCNAAVRDTVANLERPPGRQPARDLVVESSWFNGLDDAQKALAVGIIRRSVDNAIFGLFSILDGIRAVEDSDERGHFELRFVKGDVQDIISPSEAYLHEMFK